MASPSEQLDYEQNLIAHGRGWVPWELSEGWWDFYHPGESHFDNAFNAEELAALGVFNDLLDGIAKSVPDESVQAMLDNPDWQRAIEKAKQTFEVIGDTLPEEGRQDGKYI